MIRYRALQPVVARLLTEADLRAAFFADPAVAARLGLTDEEGALLRRLDARKLAIMTEGFGGKRLERLEGRYPHAWRALLAVDARAKEAFLATRPPSDPMREEEAFVRFARDGPADPDAARLLRDALAYDAALHALAARRPRPFRATPATRVHAIPAAALSCEGPWPEHVAAPRPTAYPSAPRSFLLLDATPQGLLPLAGEAAALWACCEAGATLGEITARLGDRAAREATRWLALGVVEPR